MIIPNPSSIKRARIEIIPLIDIVFFLLATFVMVSLSMVKNEGITINLPSATTAVVQEIKDVVTISVSEKGEMYYNKDKVSFDELSSRLTQLKAQSADPKVLINGDEKAFFGDAIEILDHVRKLGITKVSIRTKH